MISNDMTHSVLCLAPGGHIVKWQVMCASAGKIVLGMWRASGNQDTATLIGKNTITINNQERDTIKVSTIIYYLHHGT